jgi:hypothetical protein
VSDLVRLPVQHKERPHCPRCETDVPTFNRTNIDTSPAELGEFELLAVTFHVKCPCGAEWDLRKTVK